MEFGCSGYLGDGGVFFGQSRVAYEVMGNFKLDVEGWMLEAALKVINIEEMQKACDSE